MNLQRQLLRAMLWTLGVSAAAGVLAVFVSTRVMGRVAGTALIAAFAIGAAMPMSKMLEDAKKRVGGLVGLWAIVLGFVAALSAVWVELLGTAWDVEWRLALTAVVISVGGAVAAGLLAKFNIPWARWSARTALLVDALAAGLFLTSIWLKDNGKPAETGAFLMASGATLALALIGVGVERLLWRWLGVLASAAGLALGIAGTWFVHTHDPTTYTVSMCIAVVVAYAVVVLRVPLGDSRFWTLFAAIGSTTATGGCVSVLAVITGGFDNTGPDLLTRVTGALGIVSACSTLAVVVIYRLNRRPPGTSAVVTEIASVKLICPHCGRRCDAKVGESPCEGCGLIFTVSVREPRCVKCDYPLLDLKGAVCPECGEPRGAGVPAAT